METNISKPLWVEPELKCRRQMRLWINEAMEREGRVPWIGVHDEATFMWSWFAFYFLTGDDDIKKFIYQMRDKWYDWSRKSLPGLHAKLKPRKGNLYHGWYQQEGEDHHHTENWIRFLGRLWYLDNNNERNIKVLEDFAHHLGNWVDGIPKWYDWKKHRFLNRYLGTVEVENDPSTDFNYVGMFRWIIVALQTYLATGMRIYLDLCLDYTDRWCEFMEQTKEGEQLPMAADSNWEKIQNPKNNKLYGATRILTGGYVSVLLDLYLLTKNPRYSTMAKRVLANILKAAKLKVSSIVASNLAKYRAFTGDDEFDSVVLDFAKEMGTCPLPTQLEINGPIGGAVTWLYKTKDGGEVEIKGLPPTVEALLFQITGDIKHISHALALTARKLELIRPIGNEGRRMGCGGSNINGNVVLPDVHATLFPATIGLYGVCERGVSHYRPLVTYQKENGTIGLPEGVAALFIPINSNRRVIQLHNDNDEKITLETTAHSNLIKVGESPLKGVRKSKTVQLEPHQTIKISISL